MFPIVFRLHLFDATIGMDRYTKLRDADFRGVFSINEIMEVYYHMLYPEDEHLVSSKEVLVNWPKVMLFRKNSSLAAPISRYLELFINNGIVQHRINKYRDTKFMRFRKVKTAQILTFSQLAGIFYICGALYALAIIVFVIEIIYSIVQSKLQFMCA